MDEKQQFRLKWNDYHVNIAHSFDSLRLDEDFVDVTVICEDFQAKAHRVVLAACSSYFQEILKSNPHPHPIVILRDATAGHLAQLLDFMYHGEVNVAQDQLSEFLRLARWLQVKGLADDSVPAETGVEQVLVDTSLSRVSPSPVRVKRAEAATSHLQGSSSPPEKRQRLASCQLPVEVKQEPADSDAEQAEVEQDGCVDNTDAADDGEPPPPETQEDGSGEKSAALDKENVGMDLDAAETIKRLRKELLSKIREAEVEPLPPKDTKDGADEAGPSSTEVAVEYPPRGGRGRPRRADPYCPICGRWFQKGSNLREHVASVHFPVPSECEECGKVLKSKASLRIHRIKNHRRAEKKNALEKALESIALEKGLRGGVFNRSAEDRAVDVSVEESALDGELNGGPATEQSENCSEVGFSMNYDETAAQSVNQEGQVEPSTDSRLC